MMEEVQQAILGPPEERGPDRAVFNSVDRTWSGGVAKERSLLAVGVKGSRCYNDNMSHQFSKNLVSPVAATKVMEDEFEDDHNVRKKTAFVRRNYLYIPHTFHWNVQATTKMGIAALERLAPCEMKERLKMQAEMSNRLRPGGEHNYAWGTQQINIAHALAYQEAQGVSAGSSLNLFINFAKMLDLKLTWLTLVVSTVIPRTILAHAPV